MLNREGKIIVITILLCLMAGSALASNGEPGHGTMTHRMMMLVLQLGVILFAAKLGNMMVQRVGLPGVLGELIAGIIIGPFLLGGIHLPGFSQGLFPLFSAEFPVSPELYGICTVASIVLLFMVGLETDIRLFVQYSVAGGLVGVGGVALSFVLGDLTAVAFSRMLFGKTLGFLSPPSLFLGIISTATSVGISARILTEQRKLDSPEGVIVLAGAVIDDVLGIILLAVGLGIISASGASGAIDWVHIGTIAAKAVGIWLAATAIGLAASHRISVLLKWFGKRSAIAVMAFGFALIMAGLFEQAGLAMIIGAYVMGLSLSKTDVNHVVLEKLNSVYALLVPVFFTVMGMLVNVRLLFSGEVLIFGLLYTVVADLAKIVGCGSPAFLFGFNLRGALRIGLGMLPRGEVTLIIAGVGLAAGVLTPEIFGVVILMVLITALITPPSLVAVLRNPGSGLRKEPVAKKETQLTFDFPSGEITDLLVRKLVVAFESEGFFVHSLNRTDKIYQARKDGIVIGFQNRRKEIVFDCAERDVPLINTAMCEVYAGFEQALEELRKPVDGTTLGRRIQEPVPGAFEKASLGNYLHRNLLVPRLKSTTKDAVIDELLEILNQHGCIKNLEDARQAVLAREASMSTGIQFGIAIPHGRTDGVDCLVCAIGLKPGGIDFEAIDKQPSTIFVMVLSPRSATAPHMQFMSMVSQALNEEGRKALLRCKTRDEMFGVLAGADCHGRGGGVPRKGCPAHKSRSVP